MERRSFLKGALAIFSVAAVGVAASTGQAEAASIDKLPDMPATPAAEPAAADAKSDANGQYYYYRRPRRRVYYRPRRRVYYYRPRRVYYYRRPVYYRRIYW